MGASSNVDLVAWEVDAAFNTALDEQRLRSGDIALKITPFR